MLLHKKDNVYTSDSGKTAATNAEEDRKALKFRSTPVDSKSLKRKLKSSVVNLNDDHQKKQCNFSKYLT